MPGFVVTLLILLVVVFANTAAANVYKIVRPYAYGIRWDLISTMRSGCLNNKQDSQKANNCK